MITYVAKVVSSTDAPDVELSESETPNLGWVRVCDELDNRRDDAVDALPADASAEDWAIAQYPYDQVLRQILDNDWSMKDCSFDLEVEGQPIVTFGVWSLETPEAA